VCFVENLVKATGFKHTLIKTICLQEGPQLLIAWGMSSLAPFAEPQALALILLGQCEKAFNASHFQ